MARNGRTGKARSGAPRAAHARPTPPATITPPAAPAAAAPPHGLARSDTLAVAGTIVGVAGIVAGLFMPLAAWALGLGAIVLGVIARQKGATGRWIATVVVGLLAIACGVIVQIVVLDR